MHCGAVDVVISNCVINLVEDKRRALVEAFRALRPGGRLAILDTAFENEPSPEARADASTWCVAASAARSRRTTYEQTLVDIGFEDVSVAWQDATCGDECSGLVAGSVAVTATKPGSTPQTIRPAVASDRERIETLLTTAGLPTDGLHTDDAIVALDGETVVGAVALERFGPASMLRSLVVDDAHRKNGVGRRSVIAALEVARWAGGAEVHLLHRGRTALLHAVRVRGGVRDAREGRGRGQRARLGSVLHHRDGDASVVRGRRPAAAVEAVGQASADLPERRVLLTRERR